MVMKDGLHFDTFTSFFFPYHGLKLGDVIYVANDWSKVTLMDFMFYVMARPMIHEDVRSALVDAAIEGGDAITLFLADFVERNMLEKAKTA